MDNNEVVVAEEVAAVAENNTGIEIEPLFEEQVDFDTFSKSDFRVVKVKNCEAVPKSKKLLRMRERFFQEYMLFMSQRNLLERHYWQS